MADHPGGVQYTGAANVFVTAERYWTTIGDAAAALLLGIAKFMDSHDGEYAWMYFVATLLLLAAAVFDIPAAHFRLRDTSRGWMRYVTVVLDWSFGVLALTGFIASIVAVAGEYEALYVAYVCGIIKYSFKAIQKTMKAIKEAAA